MTTIQPARALFPVRIEREWIQFARRNGYRTRNGAAQAHFDRYMETLQA